MLCKKKTGEVPDKKTKALELRGEKLRRKVIWFFNVILAY